ncbi:MAG: NAD-dependent epimerase/dehydratase family protein [Polyangiaceae bacterium]|nr:NAD-dependent epimerase/dehydratase family protein [Polyangiaceae bacterium]
MASDQTESSLQRTIAITGSAGFLGTHLIGVLEDAPRIGKILSLDQQAPSTAGPKTQHFDIDLMERTAEDKIADILATENADTVVHLAFRHTPSHQPDEAHYLESVGTMYVLNACRRTRVTRFVLWSQTFLYGASPKNPSFLEEHHPLCAHTREPYFRDKMQAEKDALEFGKPGAGRQVAILRTAPIVGPGITNHFTRFFSKSTIPSVLGFDPLWQFLHESDAVAALKRAIDADATGLFNIAGPGVLPYSKIIKLLGRKKVPMTRPLVRLALATLWTARKNALPSSFTDYIQYSCVADTERSRRVLGFVPLHSSQEAIAELGAAQNLRDVQLLSEQPA